MLTTMLVLVLSLSPAEKGHRQVNHSATLSVESVESAPLTIWGTAVGVIEKFRGKCPVCVREGKKSKVYPGAGSCTLMHCASYYDEDGKYHYDDCNTCTTSYTCSAGHAFMEISK